MAAIYFVNHCIFAGALVVGLLLGLSLHGVLDFQSLTGVTPYRAAPWLVLVLVWSAPLALISLCLGRGSADGDAEAESDDGA